ncbi:MAG: carbohydrate binding domain-containing protein [Armatimonadia bacterium]
MTNRAVFSLLLILMAVPLVAQETPLMRNGDFEAWKAAQPDAQGLSGGWKLTEQPQVPAGWALNSHYVGEISVGTATPHGGTKYVRFAGREKQSGHLYQPLQGLQAGQWYRVSFFSRGGPVETMLYEYFKTRQMNSPMLGVKPATTDWQEFVGYVQIPPDDFSNASLAFGAQPGQPVDLDDVRIERLELPTLPPDAAPVVMESDTLRLSFSPFGALQEFYSKPLKQNFGVPTDPTPAVSIMRQGHSVPVHHVTRQGDCLEFGFLEPDAKVVLRFTPRKLHTLVEVVDVQPSDVTSLQLNFPVKRLKTIGGAFGATYDDTFGACLFCATNNTYTALRSGTETVYLGGGCRAEHGFPGAKFVLIGVPAAQFKLAVIEGEKANGLPCPVLGGKWARDSESNRKSYLFATDARDSTIDQIIKIAKTGGFGTIIFLKDNWLATHGHYDINTKNFEQGVKSVQAAVKKIKAAGLEAGVHVFGPSISPGDAYVTPKPDPRLAGGKCPPLAEALDEKTGTITLTGEANLPPRTPRSLATPGYYIQIGDEIISYANVEPGPPYRFTGCRRGALGTTISAHPAGAEVKGLLTLWGYFLIDPDSTLADEMTTNFAQVINACDFDFVYFDASDGILNDYLDRTYYLNKLHSLFYSKFKKPMLYQTSNGTGSNLQWHIVPRSASADGHGDIKGYLDGRWQGILGMGNNWTKADIGWYYWFRDVRPDQIEYVCSKALGVDGSISLETSTEATERLPQSRQMYEMIGRWEQARRENVFGESIKTKLLEPQHDFKLFRVAAQPAAASKPRSAGVSPASASKPRGAGVSPASASKPRGAGVSPASADGWALYRAKYEEPRIVDLLDGKQNVFTLNNDLTTPCLLGFDIVRPGQGQVAADYDDPKALTIETFDDPAEYKLSERNAYAKFVVGDRTSTTPGGVVRADVSQTVEPFAEALVGKRAMTMRAENKGEAGGWTGIGRRFAQPLNLSGFKAIGFWIHGDAKGETIRVQLRDTAGRNVDFLPVMSYQGWKLHLYPLPADGAFDWTKVDYLLLYFNNIPAKQTVEVKIDDIRLLPELRKPAEVGKLILEVNGQKTLFPLDLKPGLAMANEGLGGTKLWSGGLRPAEVVKGPATFALPPGETKITLSWDDPAAYPGNLQVLFYRVWPMEK